MVAPAGIEPATLGLEVLCSDPTELRGRVHIITHRLKSCFAKALQDTALGYAKVSSSS